VATKIADLKIGDKVRFRDIEGRWCKGKVMLVERYPAGRHYLVMDEEETMWDCCASQVRPG